MKGLIAAFIFSVILVVVLIVVAFMYVDLSGHKAFTFECLKSDHYCGKVKIDKYVTEDKIIFKSTSSMPDTLGLPVTSEKILYKRKTFKLLRNFKQSFGTKGQKAIAFFKETSSGVDFLFLDHPKFYTSVNVLGEDDIVFSPSSVVSYMSVIDRYNFWKKGTQLFRILIPLRQPMAPLEDILEIREGGSEYVSVLGRKIEAEAFIIKSKYLPSVKVLLSRYSHQILTLDIRENNKKYVLVRKVDSLKTRLDQIFRSVKALFISEKTEESIINDEFEKITPYAEKPDLNVSSREKDTAIVKEIFFESANHVISGILSRPKGTEIAPVVIIVPAEGVRGGGEEFLEKALAENLLEAGFIVFTFDWPGQGKSQGAFRNLSDNIMMECLRSAIRYLDGQEFTMENSINLVSYGSGGYFALKAASVEASVNATCIIKPMIINPAQQLEEYSKQEVLQAIQAVGIKTIHEDKINELTGKFKKYLESVIQSIDEATFFMGIELPLKIYRDFLERKPVDQLKEFTKPVLLITGKDQHDFNITRFENVERIITKNNPASKVAIFNILGQYVGKMVFKNEKWVFEINKDALDSIKTYLVKINEKTT